MNGSKLAVTDLQHVASVGQITQLIVHFCPLACLVSGTPFSIFTAHVAEADFLNMEAQGPITMQVLGKGLTNRGEWPSGPASSISFTEVKHGCVRSETGWATFRMNDQKTAHSAVLRKGR